MVIELTADQPAASAPMRTSRRFSSLVLGLVAALALVSGLLIGAMRTAAQPATRTVSVEVGLSEYPATVTATWWDRAGHRGTLDPWTGTAVRLQAVHVTIAVAFTDNPVQCTLKVNGAVVDTQSANGAGQIAVCEWSGP